MDGTRSAYRDTAARCPACREAMRLVEGADPVDLCDACRGVWLDWFDGNPPEIARRLKKTVSGRGGTTATGSAHLCPRCQVELGEESFRGEEVTVERCETCHGVFVTADQLPALARLPLESETPELGWWSRLVAAARSLTRSSSR